VAVLIDRAREDLPLDRLPQIPTSSAKHPPFQKYLAEVYEAVRSAEPREWGQRVGHLGELYHANSYFSQALQCYQLAMEYDPENPRWPYYLASVHQMMGGVQPVAELLERCVELAPDYRPARLKHADMHFKTGHEEEAVASYRLLLELAPDDPYGHLGLARIALDSNQWETAEAHLERAIESDPEFGVALRLMASVHEHFGRSSEMRDALDRASRSGRFRPAPDPWIHDLQFLSFETEQLLANATKAIESHDGETAQTLFNRAMEIDPQNPMVYLVLGQTVQSPEEAEKYYRNAIDVDPDSAEAYLRLGDLLAKKENGLEQAEKMYAKTLDLDPNQPLAYSSLGVCLARQGRYQEAIQAMNRGLAIHPESVDLRYNLAFMLDSMGKTDEAIEQYYELLGIKPTHAQGAAGLSLIFSTNDDFRNGEEALRWAYVANQGEGGNNPAYVYALAAAYQAAGRSRLAIDTARRSLKLARETGEVELARTLEAWLAALR
jgi:tetratricopeptide (TPR) repeat protein